MGILYSKGKSFTGSVCDTSLSTVSNHPIANSAVATAINQINSDLTELIGTIQIFAGATIPDGYLLCDGSPVSRTIYSNLYAVIGDTWGAGDGSTTFNLPDLREAAPVGVGTSTRTEGTHDAFTLGEFKDDQLQNHKHSAGVNRVNSGGAYNPGTMMGVYVQLDSWDTGVPTDGRHGNVTRGKRIGVNYIIKY